MKKIVIMTAICCLLLMTSCGSKKTKDIEKTKAVEQEASVEEDTTESFSIPPRETFAEIPIEAEKSFDYVVQTIDKTFPKAKKSVKRYYGYMGEDQVEGKLSYVFAVYDSSNGNNSSVATAAVTADGSMVYALDENSGHYWLIDKFEPEKKFTDFSWTITTTLEDELTTDEEM